MFRFWSEVVNDGCGTGAARVAAGNMNKNTKKCSYFGPRLLRMEDCCIGYRLILKRGCKRMRHELRMDDGVANNMSKNIKN